MAAPQKLDSLKIGDTPTFEVDLTDLNGTGWTGVTYDAALTSQTAPTDNALAVATVIGGTLTLNADGTATATLTPTATQANALVAGTTYYFEVQLKSAGLVSTIFTGQLQTVQDYVK